MKSIFSLLRFRQKEIDILHKENKLLKDAVNPLTSLGIPIENLADFLRPIAKVLKSEIEKKRHEAAFHDSGKASSPVTSPRTNFNWH
ncbi:MAG TPA: hypothetical protein DEO60_15265 [Bacteroidales bacterium]|jgi:hypothetical protein|nr:hypothetical protein [Bacteroidales bacterium]HBZ22490.1 hypothetical protein [Bacteroidales bacterium]